MDILYESYIQTLHPAQYLMLEKFLESSPSTIKVQRDFKRVIAIILRGKWWRIPALILPWMKKDELMNLFEWNPKLKKLLDSVEQTIEGTREISKERNFDQALQKLYVLRKTGFLPNIVTIKRLITKTKWELGKLRILEGIIAEEGISKNKSYLFYSELIQSGNFRGNHNVAIWSSHESIRNSWKYREAINAGLSPDFAYALAQGQFGGSLRWSDIKPSSHGRFQWRNNNPPLS